MVKEPTASVFVFHAEEGSGRWRLVLVHHPRLGVWLPPGGHVEPDETPAQAAVREVWEETGLVVRLLPGPAVPVPVGFPHEPVEAAWWVVQMPACPDGHTVAPHTHLDHVFLAVADSAEPVRSPGHPVAWFTAEEVAVVEGIAEDSRLQAKELFAQLDGILAG